jgi:hypothetical protein
MKLDSVPITSSSFVPGKAMKSGPVLSLMEPYIELSGCKMS